MARCCRTKNARFANSWMEWIQNKRGCEWGVNGSVDEVRIYQCGSVFELGLGVLSDDGSNSVFKQPTARRTVRPPRLAVPVNCSAADDGHQLVIASEHGYRLELRSGIRDHRCSRRRIGRRCDERRQRRTLNQHRDGESGERRKRFYRIRCANGGQAAQRLEEQMAVGPPQTATRFTVTAEGCSPALCSVIERYASPSFAASCSVTTPPTPATLRRHLGH